MYEYSQDLDYHLPLFIKTLSDSSFRFNSLRLEHPLYTTMLQYQIHGLRATPEDFHPERLALVKQGIGLSAGIRMQFLSSLGQAASLASGESVEVEVIRFCDLCGNSSNDGKARYCLHCGHRLPRNPAASNIH